MIDTDKLKSAIVENRKTQEEVARGIGISKSTFSRKMKKGGDFSIEEAKKMAEFIPLADVEAINIFFSSKVAVLRQKERV